MPREITTETLNLCAAYKRCIVAGSDVTAFVGEWAAMLGVQRPAIWRRLRSGGVLPAYAPRKEGGKGRPKGGGEPGYSAKRREASIAHSEARQPPADAERVYRDPCPRCGVRADYGCDHRSARLGVAA